MAFRKITFIQINRSLARVCLFLLFLCLPLAGIYAQDSDSTGNAESVPAMKTEFPDSILRFRVSRPSPKRAGLYSACIPGLGQLYNKQYWKVGVVYGGAAIIGGFLVSNYNEYNRYETYSEEGS